ncbi:MAG: hypothetical protein HKO68_04020 [Desulfobacterales bacterium]|nr:hypothetical protein [Deltaproteobacteria bacterium]NNL75485.1 hypothetical protein [Desulfobacterales bacterium]
MEGLYKEVAGRLVNRRRCVALTGAGISAESGIATFRSTRKKHFLQRIFTSRKRPA